MSIPSRLLEKDAILENFDLEDGYIVCQESTCDAQYWCNHIEDLLNKNLDEGTIIANSTVMVPVFPSHDVWAQVDIGPYEFGPAAYMTFNYIPDFGAPKEIRLGFWNQGEGRLSIRSVILDFIRSRVDPNEHLGNTDYRIATRCPSNTHNIAAQRQMEHNTSASWKWLCLWNIIMENACTPCVNLTQGGPGSVPVVDPGFRLPGGP